MPKPMTTIEITPLIGVSLVLVIIFLAASPLIMVPMDMAVQLPKAATTEAKSELNITISLTEHGELALNEDQIELHDLLIKLKAKLEHDPDRLVVIRADKNVKHKRILELLALVKKAGARHLALATEQRVRRSS